jgi:hypothetical protein
MNTVQQLSAHPIRTAGRIASACAAVMVAASQQIAFATTLESFGLKHGYRDPRRHPGLGDV